MEKPDNFEYVFCIRNHAKVIIIDDEIAYVGSANVTPAGLGQGLISPGNFEAGILTNNLDLVSSVRDFFAMVWDANSCTGCHRADQCE
jgi:phosphatidylserine/phosphatidylglycerophosphate/cardiolipin synthase-like enzyme